MVLRERAAARRLARASIGAHHAYYAGDFNAFFVQGEAYLQISELIWDTDGWPVSAGP